MHCVDEYPTVTSLNALLALSSATIAPDATQSSPGRQDRAAGSKSQRRIHIGEVGMTHSESCSARIDFSPSP